jgi:Skp family chaperone for outer membrane proteins
VKKILYVFAGIVALGGLGWVGTWVSAQQQPPGTIQPASTNNAKPVSKIGVVNIAKVLKNFTKANYLGDTLLKEAKQHEDSLKLKQQELKKLEMNIAMMAKGPAQDEEAKKLRQANADLQELEIQLRKKVSERQADMANEVMKSIDHIVDFLAKQNGLELVLQYPDATTEEEAKLPVNSIRRLSAPAVMVAWRHPGLDISDEVVRYLNHYFPAPQGYTPSGAANLASPPAGGNPQAPPAAPAGGAPRQP